MGVHGFGVAHENGDEKECHEGGSDTSEDECNTQASEDGIGGEEQGTEDDGNSSHEDGFGACCGGLCNGNIFLHPLLFHQ